jgi:3-mercaptopyruvate sulfurtransferase SseA
MSAIRVVLIAVVAAGVLLAGAAPAAPPESPVAFIKVDELKALLDRGTKADIIDVRHWEAYVESHIRGARSIPVRSVADRAKEISKSALVVFY